jgi:TIR domain-containing protein
MARKDTKHYSLDELKAKHHRGDYVQTRPDAPEIEVDEEFWRTARVVMPGETGKTSDADGNYGRWMMDVFISYSHHDDDVARDIERRLKRKRIHCFLDRRMDAGEHFEGEIKDKLKFCKEVFALISHNSLKTEWVLVECGAAWALGKHISPILIGCGAELLPSVLKPLQAKDYSKIREIIDACYKRLSFAPDLIGEWAYEFVISGRLRYEGHCNIYKDKEERLHFSGTRTREMLDGQWQEVKRKWATEWVEIYSDQKIRAEYKLENVSPGFMSLVIPPERPVAEIRGEAYILRGSEYGSIEFKRIPFISS